MNDDYDKVEIELDKAQETLSKMIGISPARAWIWHCHVARFAMERGMSYGDANKVAADTMKNLLKVDVNDYDPERIKAKKNKAQWTKIDPARLETFPPHRTMCLFVIDGQTVRGWREGSRCCTQHGNYYDQHKKVTHWMLITDQLPAPPDDINDEHFQPQNWTPTTREEG
jgi:hypothetical protein